MYELLRHCLDWPIDLIAPQKSTRGFIDYYLTFRNPQAYLRIEVKLFDGELKDEHIRKYLVRRGPKRQDLDVGVLTNLKEWRIYVAIRTVKTASGVPMNEVEGITIEGPADLHRLRQLIGFRSNGGLRHHRAALGETESVLEHLLCHDRTVLRAIRDELFQIKTHHALEVRVPQYQQLRRLVTTFIQRTPLTDCPF